MLAAKGLVHAQPKTGTRVRPRSEWNIADPDVLAWRVEAGADRELTNRLPRYESASSLRRRGSPPREPPTSEIEAIREAYRAMEAGVKDQAAYLAADLLFHERILGACHNELLEHLGPALRAVFRAMFTYTTRRPPRGGGAAAPPCDSRGYRRPRWRRRRGGDANVDRRNRSGNPLGEKAARCQHALLRRSLRSTGYNPEIGNRTMICSSGFSSRALLR